MAKYNLTVEKRNLASKLERIEKLGLPNKFSYANYGVQYNPIYDKRSGKLISMKDSGLKREDYHNLLNLMASAPELDVSWVTQSVTNAAVRALATMFNVTQDISPEQIQNIIKNGINFMSAEDVKKFTDAYMKEVKEYNLDNDKDFDYNMLKTIFDNIMAESSARIK